MQDEYKKMLPRALNSQWSHSRQCVTTTTTNNGNGNVNEIIVNASATMTK